MNQSQHDAFHKDSLLITRKFLNNTPFNILRLFQPDFIFLHDF